MNNIELHIFTNSTISSPSTKIIEKTYNSFLNTFLYKGNVVVWYDPKPNIKESNLYFTNLKNFFTNINLTTSLSDGYIKAINSSKSKFMFMLEHDWMFTDNIDHSLTDILHQMEEDNIFHLRFNKRKNQIKLTDKWLKEVKGEYIAYCKTPSVSNNPHIINRQRYIKYALPYIKLDSGSLGLEQSLNKLKNINGTIYGGLNHEATCLHLDGKKNAY